MHPKDKVGTYTATKNEPEAVTDMLARDRHNALCDLNQVMADRNNISDDRRALLHVINAIRKATTICNDIGTDHNDAYVVMCIIKTVCDEALRGRDL